METFVKIRKYVFIIWGAMVVAAMLLWAFGILPIGWALLPIAFPIGVLLSVLLFICGATLIGDYLKTKNPPTCDNCIWGKARKVSGHCLGETFGETFGTKCQYYQSEDNI